VVEIVRTSAPPGLVPTFKVYSLAPETGLQENVIGRSAKLTQAATLLPRSREDADSCGVPGVVTGGGFPLVVGDGVVGFPPQDATAVATLSESHTQRARRIELPLEGRSILLAASRGPTENEYMNGL
jgi:hypothetical protein